MLRVHVFVDVETKKLKLFPAENSDEEENFFSKKLVKTSWKVLSF